jgi:hypothetical protein
MCQPSFSGKTIKSGKSYAVLPGFSGVCFGFELFEEVFDDMISFRLSFFIGLRIRS